MCDETLMFFMHHFELVINRSNSGGIFLRYEVSKGNIKKK